MTPEISETKIMSPLIVPASHLEVVSRRLREGYPKQDPVIWLRCGDRNEILGKSRKLDFAEENKREERTVEKDNNN